MYIIYIYIYLLTYTHIFTQNYIYIFSHLFIYFCIYPLICLYVNINCMCVCVSVCMHLGSQTTIPNHKLQKQRKNGAPRWFADKVGGNEVCELSFVAALRVILQCSLQWEYVSTLRLGKHWEPFNNLENHG